MSGNDLNRTGKITCPGCGLVTTEAMPEDACLHLFECPGCQALLRPLLGDCCVFCSYCDQQCPPRLKRQNPQT